MERRWSFLGSLWNVDNTGQLTVGIIPPARITAGVNGQVLSTVGGATAWANARNAITVVSNNATDYPDYATLALAFAALVNGGVILLKRGVAAYDIDGLAIPANTWIIGDANPTLLATTGTGWTLPVGNVWIDGCYFDMNETQVGPATNQIFTVQTGTKGEIRDCTFVCDTNLSGGATEGSVFRGSGSTDFIISRCSFIGTGGNDRKPFDANSGVFYATISDCAIGDNTNRLLNGVENGNFEGKMINNTMYFTLDDNKVIFPIGDNTVFENNYMVCDGTPAATAYFLQIAENCRILDNLLFFDDANSGSLMTILGQNGTANYNTIRGNRFDTGTSNGTLLWLDLNDHNRIANNYFASAVNGPVNLATINDFNSVTGNTSLETGNGANVHYSGNDTNTITGNVLQHTGFGASPVITMVDTCAIDGNVLLGTVSTININSLCVASNNVLSSAGVVNQTGANNQVNGNQTV